MHALITGAGLERFYELRGGAGSPPAELRPNSFAWLEPLLSPEGGDGTRRAFLDVQGIHCAACVWLLRELFLRRAGAVDLRINPSRGQAELIWIPARLDLTEYLAEAERFGYRFGPVRKDAPRGSRDLLVRIGISAAAAANVMLFSISFYAGLSPADGALHRLFGRLSLALTALAVATGGWIFFRSAIAGLRARVVHLDLPIALGIALSFAGSVWAYATRGPEAAYFDTVATFVTLMLVGRFLQERVLERNRDALLASDGVEHLVTRRLREGRLEAVPTASLRAGDEICVVPGEWVPVEAVLLDDGADLALDWITGESDVRPADSGARVPAGAFNAGRRALRLAVLEDFSGSRLNDLLAAPRDAATARPAGPAGRFWHRTGTIYVVAVLTLATVGFLGWLGAGAGRALEIAVAILVVTCPCAIGLAVPLARELTHTALRRRGVFLRDGTFLERALRVRKILFDKTGTLTRGVPALGADSLLELARLTDQERSVLRAMASRSNHPASRAISAALGGAGEATPDLTSLEERPGRGLEWCDGVSRWRLGRPDHAVPAPPGAVSEGRVVFSRDGVPLAAVLPTEEIRPGVADEVGSLRQSGFEIRILSGDAVERVRAVARAAGVAEDLIEGALEPEAKARRIREIDRRDTLMVGDGINDAPAFSSAFCTATPAVDRPALPARADFYYLGDGIAAVRRTLAAARALRRTHRANLVFAVVYNAVALALCFAGLVQPLIAAILMPLSSLAVVGHTIARFSARRLRWMS